MHVSMRGHTSVDELIRKLETRRAAMIARASEILNLAASRETLSNTPDELAEYDKLTSTDEAGEGIAALDKQIGRLKDQAEREKRAAAANAGNGHTADPAAAGDPRHVITSEPTTYGRGSRHSYFLDMARAELRHGDGDGGVAAARERQARHETELRKVMPARLERRRRDADRAMENLLTGDQQERRSMTRSQRRIADFERRAYEQFVTAGNEVFQGAAGAQEQRFISRTDGAGGYLVPPLWLIDEYIPYLRAGRVFADQWRRFPLPAGTDSINIPRLVLGTATGPQTADGGPVPGRDAQDNFVNALVRTVAGQQDAAIQILDQSPLNFDQIIFPDMMADLAMQLSAQLMIGSGVNGQLTGLYTAGTLGTSTGFGASGYVVNNAANAWTAASGTANFYLSLGQLISTLSRTRFRPPTGMITNTAVWFGMATAMDSQNRPLVVPQMQGNNFNQAAGDDDGPETEGPVGHIQGLPWLIDPNIPLTFGGTVAPSIGTISNGNTAPVPGSGGNPVYTPAIAAIWDDLYLWEGELRSRVLQEVLSGTLQVRFQVYEYVADMPNRYQNSSSQPISYGNYNTVGTTSTVLSTSGLLSGF